MSAAATPCLVLADMREHRDAGHVADRPHVLRPRAAARPPRPRAGVVGRRATRARGRPRSAGGPSRRAGGRPRSSRRRRAWMRTPGSTRSMLAPSRTRSPRRRAHRPSARPRRDGRAAAAARRRSTIVTCDPMRAKACASSHPTGPAPITISRPGTSCVVVASRFVQYSTAARPGMGGICGTDPVATTSRPKPIVRPSTSTAPGRAMRPRPRTSSMSRSASHCSWLESSRRPSPSRGPERPGDIDRPVAASAAPGTSARRRAPRSRAASSSSACTRSTSTRRRRAGSRRG